MPSPIPHLLHHHKATGRAVEAVCYLEDMSNVTFVRSFLDAHTNSLWDGPHTSMGGGRYHQICFHHAPGSTLYVSPGQVVYVYTDTLEPGVLTIDDFFQYFTKEPPTPKEPMKEETPMSRPTIEDLTFEADPTTEFGEHVTDILDVLAILRESTDATHIDIATREILGLLSAAFNEGWSTGVQHAQTNPYVDWAE